MSEQLISQLCMTFESMNTPDNNVRSQAQNFLKSVNKGKQSDIASQAALYLKLKVQQSWGEDMGKENMNSNNSNTQQSNEFAEPLTHQDKEFLRHNIFKALDQAQGKTIQSAFQNIVYNIAQVDFPENWSVAIPEIDNRLKSGNENSQISGLIALKQVMEAFQFSLDHERAPLNVLVDVFFPVLEVLMQNISNSSSENQVQIMHLIAKIFFAANNVEISQFFVNNPQKVSPWIQFFLGIMETQLGDQFETPTESCQGIEELDRTLCWKLKGIVAQNLHKLFQKYTAILIECRFGTANQVSDTQQQLRNFAQYFEVSHTQQVLQTLLKVILDKRTKFVGTKTFCSALKSVQVAIKQKKTRDLIQEHISTILYDISLPQMLINENEYNLFNENAIEYVRMQVDQSNAFNAKHIIIGLVKTICGIKQNRKQKISPHLQNYLQVLAQNLETPNDDFRIKEAVLHSLGNLADLISKDRELMVSVEPLLQTFVYSELQSPNPYMKARACWLYGQFGKLPFNEDHLRHVLNDVFQCLSNEHLPVRVEAALALNFMLSHQIAIDFLRPGLETLLKTYLKIMDDIDFDELIKALQEIVDVYEDEIAPYALQLCQKLGDAYLRLISNKGTGDDEDQETTLSADGLMTAIRRVLESISGKEYKQLYPQLEEILEQPLFATLSPVGEMSTSEGLTCISELLYNQDQVSMRMWKFYVHIIDLVVNNKAVLDENIAAAAVPLMNYISKDPNQFLQANFDGHSALDMMFGFIGRVFEVANLKEDEIEAMCAVTLLIALLENVSGIESSLHNIIEYLIRQLGDAKTPDYKCMISQGVCMALMYNTQMALVSLEQMGCTENWVNLIFSQLDGLKQDFEIKRFIIGLSSLIQRDMSELPPSIQNQLPGIIKALVFLCQKSIVIREKALQKEKAEECEDEQENDAIIEDEDNECELMSDEEDDEDYDCNEEMERDLYDSKLDEVDEVIYFRDVFVGLEQSNPNMYNYYLQQCLDTNEQQNFQQAIDKAIQYQQMVQSQQQQQQQ
eukprot:403334157